MATLNPGSPDEVQRWDGGRPCDGDRSDNLGQADDPRKRLAMTIAGTAAAVHAAEHGGHLPRDASGNGRDGNSNPSPGPSASRVGLATRLGPPDTA